MANAKNTENISANKKTENKSIILVTVSASNIREINVDINVNSDKKLMKLRKLLAKKVLRAAIKIEMKKNESTLITSKD